MTCVVGATDKKEIRTPINTPLRVKALIDSETSAAAGRGSSPSLSRSGSKYVYVYHIIPSTLSYQIPKRMEFEVPTIGV